MISATPLALTTATLEGAPAGATITARLVDGDETLATVVTVTPKQHASGVALDAYTATFIAPAANALPVVLEWLEGATVVGSELVESSTSAPLPPTYSDAANVYAYVTGRTIEAAVLAMDPDALNQLIRRSERDVDSILGPAPLLESGLRYDPLTLTTQERAALARAVAAQVEYRLEMGEEFFVRAQYDYVGGPDFSFRGQLSYIGPKVRRELAGTTLLDRLSGSGIASIRVTTPLSPPSAA